MRILFALESEESLYGYHSQYDEDSHLICRYAAIPENWIDTTLMFSLYSPKGMYSWEGG